MLAAVAALAWATAHTPPPEVIARMLDARLGFRDRVSAALQLQPIGGPIATLVARDAAARLASFNPAALFPLTFGRTPVVTLAVAVAMAAWLASSRVDDGRAPARAASTDGGASESGEAGEPAREASSAAGSNPGRPATGGRPAVVRREPATGERNGTTPSADGPGAQARGALPIERSPAADATGRPVNRSPTNQPAAATPVASTATGTAARGGSAAGRAANGGLSTGAGGAAPGNAFAAPSGAEAVPRPLITWSGVARANAEAALARDVIPPDYRDARARLLPGDGAGGSR